VEKGYSVCFPKQLEAYGLFRFLTNQCAVIQLVNAILHVLAHFVKPLRSLRDLVFTTLAFPVGSVVVFTFWLIWFQMGRETIFPTKLDEFYPLWLNHTNHTIIVPINLLLAVFIDHKYFKYGAAVTSVYMVCYTAFLHVVKMKTGLFVYNYLDALDDVKRLLYFASTGLFAYLTYELGSLITNFAHSSGQVVTKKPKGQKQR